MRFSDQGSEEFYDGLDSKAARRTLPNRLHGKAQSKLTVLAYADGIDDLHVPPNNHLEKLKGGREGQYSIRINEQFRICFRWVDGEAVDVHIADYH